MAEFDLDREGDALRLEKMADQLKRMASEVRARGTRGGGPIMSAQWVRAILEARRLREQHLDPALFADPAWDMLLTLLVAELEGASICTTDVWSSAGVAPATAMRWIEKLEERGLVERRADPGDVRRRMVSLTAYGVEKMTLILSGVAHIN